MLDSKELRDRRGDPEILTQIVSEKPEGFFWGEVFETTTRDGYILYMYI